jgi:hypothetical protein
LAAGFAESFLRKKKTTTDEDDSAERMKRPCLWLAWMPILCLHKGTNLGDVVPFFSVPRKRTCFSLSFVETNADVSLLLVANVASEIGIVAKEGDGDWEIIEIPEGATSSCL